MHQNRITEKTMLLDEKGNVINPGYCEYNRYLYNRKDIKAKPGKIKEWDYYQISDDRHTIHFNIFDVSIAGSFKFTMFDRVTGEEIEKFAVTLLTYGNLELENDTNKPHAISFRSGDTYAKVVSIDGRRNLFAEFSNGGVKYQVNLTLVHPTDLQSLVMAVPFKKDKHFFLNQKMNSMVASGTIKADGVVIKEFLPDNSFGILDWGRGVWPHEAKWHWGNGCCRLPDGHIFGFEIGWGFGDMSYATENAIFYDGVLHKLEEIYLNRDESDYMKPWIFSSNDGRFEMTMVPEFDYYTNSRVGNVAGNICHQVFGKWSGHVTLDNGQVLEIKDMLAFCEDSDILW